MGVKFDMVEGTFGPLLLAKFHRHRCKLSHLRGEKPQNRPLNKLNNRRFALRAMPPINKKTQRFWPPRRRVKSETNQTWHGDRGPRARSCTSETFGRLTHSFAARGR